jgi:N12 class adenine-specific DNA methylase
VPSSAFKKNAGTEVTTDILFFKKRAEGAEPGSLEWTGVVKRTLPDAKGGTTEGNVSRYFSDHPEQVLGQEGFFDKLYEGRYGVRPIEGQDLEADLRAAVDRLPKDVMDHLPTPEDRAALDFASGQKKDGSFYTQNGRLMQYRNGVGRPVEQRGAGVTGGMTAAEMERVQTMIPVRDALREVFRADLAEDTEAAAKAREDLNRHYDRFVRKYGPINKTDYQYRRPNIIQAENARAEAREMARDRGEYFDEGEFDPTPMIERKAKTQEIARARKDAMDRAEREGRKFDHGSFDPDDMPDIVIEKRPNIDPFMDDQESYRLRSVEYYDDATGKATKRRIFDENILTKEQEPEIKSANDGVLWSLNKHGRLDLDAIAAKMGTDRQGVINELGDSIFKVPGTDDTYQTKDEYLSGDVVDKLAVARAHAASDPDVRRNVSALDAAQPAPLAPSEITMTLGMPWIPPETIAEFARDRLGIGEPRVRHSDVTGGWIVDGSRAGDGPGRAEWGTQDRGAFDLLADSLNRTPPRIYRTEKVNGSTTRTFDAVATQAAQDKYDAMRQAFDDWAGGDPARADSLATLYNDKLNRVVLRQFDGSYLTTPGVSTDWSWRPHQKRVVARIIQDGSTYMAHAVGAGKTSAMIGAGMEMRRLGLVRKPMYVVPNHMLGQFAKEFYEQYPTARIAVADERRFHTDRRKQFVADVSQNDLDAIIITHSGFGKIPISDEFQAHLISEQIDMIDAALSELDAKDDRITVKRLEKQKEKLEQKLSGRGAGKQDAVNTFEEMGVDFAFVDEAHGFRKLSFGTKQSGLKGITPEGSNAAWDLYTKLRYLDSKSPGRSAVLASGTPVTNTMGELYTISRYLQPEELERRGLSHFDSWASTFGDVKNELEQTADGSYAPVTRFSRFVNIPELYKMVGGVMDVVTPSQLEQYVVRPKMAGGQRQFHLAPLTDTLRDYQQVLADRIKAIRERKGPPQKGDDILLSVINDGRHAAIDPRFVAGAASPNDPSSKLNAMIDNVHRIWKDTKNQQFYDPKTNYEKPLFKGPAAQMVFANLGIGEGGTRDFSGYQWMKSDLIRRGVPANEIAFIKDYKSHVARQKLFNDVNEGKVRILIGSTQKMGTGVNAQRRLVALHNQDPLWFPADDEQRVGRAIRQGNLNPEVQIHDYSTKGTYDSTMWQMMGRKGRFIEQFFRGDPELRDMEDLGEASMYEQASAMATSDERLITLTDLRQQLDKAQRRLQAYDREQYGMKARARDAQSRIAHFDKRIPAVQQDLAQRKDTRGELFNMRVGSKPFAVRKDAAIALSDAHAKVFPGLPRGGEAEIGSIGGFPLIVAKDGRDNPEYYLRRNGDELDQLKGEGHSASSVIGSAEHRIRNMEGDLRYSQEQRAEAQRYLDSLRPQIGKPFEGYDEIERLRRAVSDLETELKPVEKPKELPVGEAAPEDEAAQQHGAVEALPGNVGEGQRRRLASNLTGTFKPESEFTPAERALSDRVNEIARKMAPGTKTQAATSLRGEDAGGQRFGTFGATHVDPESLAHIVSWSLKSPDAEQTMRHEVIHQLRRSGLLGADEWAALTKGAADDGWSQKYDVANRWPGLSADGHLEEAIAERFSDWRRDGGLISRLPEWLQPIFYKLDLFRRRVAAAARSVLGKNVTPDDVFTRIESGAVGRRAGESTGVPEMAAAAQRGSAQRASILADLKDALLARGWRIDHVSKKGDSASSYYLSRSGELNGEQIRISDHALGMKNGERQGGSWKTNVAIEPGLSLGDHIAAIENEDYRHAGDGFGGGYSFREWQDDNEGAANGSSRSGEISGRGPQPSTISPRQESLTKGGEQDNHAPGASVKRAAQRPTIDQTDQGPQRVIPGAERVTPREAARVEDDRRAQQEAKLLQRQSKLRSGKPQEEPGGLFGDQQPKQGALFQRPANPEVPEIAPGGHDPMDNVADAMAEANGGKGAGTYARTLARMLPSAKGAPTKFLGALEKFVILPRSLATMDWRSSRVWDEWRRKDATANGLHHDWAEKSKGYVDLSPAQRTRLHAVEELDRLNGRVRPNDGRQIVARNEGQEEAEHSKPGQAIALDPATSAVYHERRALFRDVWNTLTESAARKLGWDGAVDPAAIRAAADRPMLAAGEAKRLRGIADLVENMQGQARSGYVPLMRFGDYYIAVKEKAGKAPDSLGGHPDVVRFELVDSKGAFDKLFGKADNGRVPKTADARIKELRAKYPGNWRRGEQGWESDTHRIEDGYLARNAEALRKLDIPAVEKLFMALQQKDSELYGPMVEKMRDQMYEEMKAGFKRRSRTVPGYSPDFERATGSYLGWTSGHAADMLHRDAIRQAQEAYIDTHPDPGVRQYWQKWSEYQNSPKTEMQALRQFGFYWALAANPSSTALIATHGPMVAHATLGAGVGYGAAGRHLYGALGEAVRAIRVNGERGLHVDMDRMGRTPAEKALIAEALRTGLIHAVAADDIRGLGQGHSEALRPHAKMWGRMLDIAASNISTADQVNRVGALLAGYRLYSQPGMLEKGAKAWGNNQVFQRMAARDGLTPASMAKFLVDEGLFVWGKTNRAPMARGAAGTMLFQFRNFEMNYLSSVWKMMHRMGPEGKGAALFMMAGLGMLGGALGLPFAGDAEKAYDEMHKMLTGIDPQAEARIYQLMEDVGFSKLAAEMMLRGPARSVLGIDLSSRLGFGDAGSKNLTPTSALGVVPSMLYQRLSAAHTRYTHGGQPIAAAAELLPSAARNLVRGAEAFPTEGVRTQKGDVIVPAKDVTTADQVAAGLGFTGARLARDYEYRDYEYRTDHAKQELQAEKLGQATAIEEQAMAASARGDAAEAGRLQDELHDLLAKNPDVAVTAKAIKQRLAQRISPDTTAMKRGPRGQREAKMNSPFAAP